MVLENLHPMFTSDKSLISDTELMIPEDMIIDYKTNLSWGT